MSEKVTAVALFFDDAELGSHLRNALNEHGARIAHEGPIGSFDEAALRSAEVDVLVVNLDDTVDDDSLDSIYDLVQSGETPVVFNDAQASRALDGWDRARWARHLAAKVLNRDSIDPPRPDNAREVDVPAAPVHEADEAPAMEAALAMQPPVHDGSGPDSDALEAELEALLASGDAIDTPINTFAAASSFGGHSSFERLDENAESELDAPHAAHDPAPFEVELDAGIELEEPQAHAFSPMPEDALDPLALHDAGDLALTDFDESFGSGLKFKADDVLPPLHDGNFGEPASPAPEAAAVARDEPYGFTLDTGSDEPSPPLHETAFGEHDAHLQASSSDLKPVEKVHFATDHLSLADDDALAPVEIVKENLAQQTSAPIAPEWDFLADDDYLPPAKKEVGVEKMSAADYLAPDVEEHDGSPRIKAGLSLELVSNEEALAPALQQDMPVHEMRLHDGDAALTHLLVLGAARDGNVSLQAFLAALPGNVKVPVLLTQHHADESAEALAQTLAQQSAMPVKIASPGARARAGEILLVPRGQHVRVMRDGRLDITATAETAEPSPSIDGSFTMAANVFGRDALAIVFSGKSTDAVAGAQAIYDRGGQVWVESSPADYADMVHGVLAERLVSFSGSPQELAARLVEDFR